jgi:hypothetical protein
MPKVTARKIKPRRGRPPIGRRAMTSKERAPKFRATQQKRFADFETGLGALEEKVALLSATPTEEPCPTCAPLASNVGLIEHAGARQCELCDLHALESEKPRVPMWYETRYSQPNPNPNFMDNGIRTRWIVGYKGSPDNRALQRLPYRQADDSA